MFFLKVKRIRYIADYRRKENKNQSSISSKPSASEPNEKQNQPVEETLHIELDINHDQSNEANDDIKFNIDYASRKRKREDPNK